MLKQFISTTNPSFKSWNEKEVNFHYDGSVTRFTDCNGQTLRTSTVQSIVRDEFTLTISTKNSTYTVQDL